MPSAAARQKSHFVFLHQYNLINVKPRRLTSPDGRRIASTLRSQTDNSTGLFRCGRGLCVPQRFVCSEAEQQSQMGVHWSPDDLPQRSGWHSVKGEKRKLGRGFWFLVVNTNFLKLSLRTRKVKKERKSEPERPATPMHLSQRPFKHKLRLVNTTRSSRLQRVTAVILFELQDEQSNRVSTNSWKGTPTDG